MALHPGPSPRLHGDGRGPQGNGRAPFFQQQKRGLSSGNQRWQWENGPFLDDLPSEQNLQRFCMARFDYQRVASVVFLSSKIGLLPKSLISAANIEHLTNKKLGYLNRNYGRYHHILHMYIYIYQYIIYHPHSFIIRYPKDVELLMEMYLFQGIQLTTCDVS